jgi:predicted phage terminase large subunit-like protein
MAVAEVTRQEAAQELLSRRYAREDYEAFVLRVSEHVPALHHQLLIRELEAVIRGEVTRLMVFMPPGAAKSTYASILFPPFFLGRNPDKNVICASYSQRLSSRFGKKCRNYVASTEFRAIFGFGLSGDTKAKDEWETAAGGEYTATSIDGAVTGRRGDLIVIDDPIKGRAEADSETIRDTGWEWWKSDLRTRLKPGGSIVLIQTRWHEDDIAGRILPEDYAGESGDIISRDGETWRVVSLKAQAEEGDPLGRKPGEYLWPEWFSEKEFKLEKVIQGERNWSALYQQRPSPETGNYFRRSWIQYYDIVPKHLAKYGASDYAVTAGGGDYTIHGVAGVDPNDDLYILDWYREQADSEEWVDELLDLMKQWKPSEWAEESGQIEKGVGPFIDKRQQEERIYCYRKQFASVYDKATRAQAIRGRMAQGKVYFPRNKPWVTDLIKELMSFPTGKYDDQVDTMALFGRMLSTMNKAKDTSKVEKPRYGSQQTFNELRDLITKQRKQDEQW